jgi:hypothetical protein
MPVCFTDDEWDFVYSTFQQLTSVESTIEEVGGAIRAENQIWELLKAKEALRESSPIEGSDRGSIGVSSHCPSE